MSGSYVGTPDVSGFRDGPSIDARSAECIAPNIQEISTSKADIAQKPVHQAISMRPIAEADLPGVANFVSRHCEDDSGYDVRVLNRLKTHPTPEGYPKYGYVMLTGTTIVGAVVLIFSNNYHENDVRLRCHMASFYIEPEFKNFAHFFLARAFKHREVIYMKITTSVTATPLADVQGFTQYASGQYMAVPLLSRASVPRGTRIIGPESMPDAPFDPAERQILLDHAEFGCISCWCVTKERAYPFVFRSRRSMRIIPGVQLVYCGDVADFVKFASPLGRHLLRFGAPFVRIDAKGPIAGLPGRFWEGASPRWFKGLVAPHLGDLAYTQFAMCGDRPPKSKRT